LGQVLRRLHRVAAVFARADIIDLGPLEEEHPGAGDGVDFDAFGHEGEVTRPVRLDRVQLVAKVPSVEDEAYFESPTWTVRCAAELGCGGRGETDELPPLRLLAHGCRVPFPGSP